MVKISIILKRGSDGREIYYPGQKLTGVVQIDLKDHQKFRGCYVQITGKARSHWTESKRSYVHGKYRNRIVSFDGEEVYLNSTTYLFGYHGAEAVQMAIGVYSYNFMVDLPKPIPETLASSLGCIQYLIEVVLEVPWGFNKDVKKPFTVMRFDNLNDHPDLRVPLEQKNSRVFYTFRCQSGRCNFIVSIPHRGFSAGQAIPIKIECENNSQTDINQIQFKLTRTFTFTSITPIVKSKTKTEKLVQMHVAGVKNNQTKEIKSSLKIPSNIPNSNSQLCRVVQVSYTLKIVCIVSGFNGASKFIFPITIGAVSPLNHSLNSTQTAVQAPMTTSQYPVVNLRPPYQPDLPPSFEEAMSCEQNQK